MGFFTFQDPKEMVTIDYDKVKTVEDITVLLKAMYPNIQFDLNGEQGKQLAKFKKDDNE